LLLLLGALLLLPMVLLLLVPHKIFGTRKIVRKHL
jgi:hypothetical protein